MRNTSLKKIKNGKTARGVLHEGVYEYSLFQGVLCLEDVRFHSTRLNVILYMPLRIM